MTQTINASGLMIIKKAEGLVLTATPDPVGILTIGYGHTVGVTAGEAITQAQAEQLLAQDLLLFETGVASLVPSSSGNEFSAMVSLAYNIGLTAFKSSTVRKDHNACNKQAAAAAFLLWDKAHVNGQLVELPGLLVRRRAESTLYLTPDVPPVSAPTETVLDTIIDSSGKTHQIIDRINSVASSAISGATVSAFLALALLGCCHGNRLQLARQFDWGGSTFYLDRDLRPVEVHHGSCNADRSCDR